MYSHLAGASWSTGARSLSLHQEPVARAGRSLRFSSLRPGRCPVRRTLPMLRLAYVVGFLAHAISAQTVILPHVDETVILPHVDAATATVPVDKMVFVHELEQCIRGHATRLAASFPTWGNGCMPPTTKVDVQAQIYESTLTPIYEKYGYQAALWCAMYSLGMTGAEYDPNDTQPNNPNFSDWVRRSDSHRELTPKLDVCTRALWRWQYTKLMCPWNLWQCGNNDDDLTADEASGVPVCPWDSQGDDWKCAPNQHPQYPIWPADVYVKDEPDRRTMSCALCGRLARTFPTGPPIGAPTKIKEAIGVEYSLAGVPESERHLYTGPWRAFQLETFALGGCGLHDANVPCPILVACSQLGHASFRRVVGRRRCEAWSRLAAHRGRACDEHQRVACLERRGDPRLSLAIRPTPRVQHGHAAGPAPCVA